MSTRKETVIIEPPMRIRKEGFCTGAMRCRYCGGRGWFVGERKDSEGERCPDCEGSGEVYAMVTIDWMPVLKDDI